MSKRSSTVVAPVELPRDRVPEEDEVRVGAELRALCEVVHAPPAPPAPTP